MSCMYIVQVCEGILVFWWHNKYVCRKESNTSSYVLNPPAEHSGNNNSKEKLTRTSREGWVSSTLISCEDENPLSHLSQRGREGVAAKHRILKLRQIGTLRPHLRGSPSLPDLEGPVKENIFFLGLSSQFSTREYFTYWPKLSTSPWLHWQYGGSLRQSPYYVIVTGGPVCKGATPLIVQ